jgi:hypothetical protein
VLQALVLQQLASIIVGLFFLFFSRLRVIQRHLPLRIGVVRERASIEDLPKTHEKVVVAFSIP